jgi:hypothetical protein
VLYTEVPNFIIRMMYVTLSLIYYVARIMLA